MLLQFLRKPLERRLLYSGKSLLPDLEHSGPLYLLLPRVHTLRSHLRCCVIQLQWIKQFIEFIRCNHDFSKFGPQLPFPELWRVLFLVLQLILLRFTLRKEMRFGQPAVQNLERPRALSQLLPRVQLAWQYLCHRVCLPAQCLSGRERPSDNEPGPILQHLQGPSLRKMRNPNLPRFGV